MGMTTAPMTTRVQPSPTKKILRMKSFRHGARRFGLTIHQAPPSIG
jgi:hypothetical protein